MFNVSVGDSHFDVLDVWSDADDVVDDGLFEPKRRNDHPARFRSQIVETRQLKLNFGAIFLILNMGINESMQILSLKKIRLAYSDLILTG